ncbi:2992_t:CDS:2, partial [Funneliformis caledonium]
VINSVPALQISDEETNEIPFPDMGFYAMFPFNIECQFDKFDNYDNEIDKIEIDESCNNFLVQPQMIDDGYFGYFLNNNNLNFTRINNQMIEIHLLANTSDNESISFSLVDSENNPLKFKDGNVDLEPIKNFIQIRELIANNEYEIVKNQVSLVGLTRNKRKIIHPKFSGILGVRPSYKTQPRIISTIQSISIPVEPSTNYFSRIELTVKSFRMQVETEQRTRTLLGVFGLVGGAWGLASALYATSFGVDTIRPWGCLQYYCGLRHRTHNKFKKTIPVLPLINTSSSMTELDSYASDFKELRDRLISLEIFLKEYVVDIKFLEISEKMDQNDRNDNI